MKDPIYVPKGRAKEYGDYALNIYNGCNHSCVYCYAPKVMHQTKEQFIEVKPRNGLLEALEKQLAIGEIKGKLIHLCFTCDPYPADIDTSITREVIKRIKASGNNVQILTKAPSRASRDFDLLTLNDKFGTTITGSNAWCAENEPKADSLTQRIEGLKVAKTAAIKTWVSFEPVYFPYIVYEYIQNADYIDLYKIGKLNYAPSDVDWKEFGYECEALCKKYGRNYYLKQDLRDLM